MKKILLVLMIICYQNSFCVNIMYKQNNQVCDSIIASTKEFIKYAMRERHLYNNTIFVINMVEFNERENVFRYSIGYFANRSELNDIKPDAYFITDDKIVIVKIHEDSINCNEIKPIDNITRKKIVNHLFDDSNPLSGIHYEMALLQIVEQKGNKISKSMHIRMHNAYPEEYSLYYVPNLLIKTIKTEDILNSSKPDTFFIAPKK